jgi:hypothetical protein
VACGEATPTSISTERLMVCSYEGFIASAPSALAGQGASPVASAASAKPQDRSAVAKVGT